MLSKLSAFQPNHLDFDSLRTAASFARKRESVRDWQTQPADPELPPQLADEQRQLAEIAVLQRLQVHPANPQQTDTYLKPEQPLAEPAPFQETQAALTTTQAQMQAQKPELGVKPEPDPGLQRRQQQQRLSGLRVQQLLDLHALLNDISQLAQAGQGPLEPLQARLLSLQTRLMKPYLGPTALSEAAGFGVVRPFLARQNQKLEALKQKMTDSLPRIAEAEAKAAKALKMAPQLAPSEKAALLKLGKRLSEVLQQLCPLVNPSQDAPAPEAELPPAAEPLDPREQERHALLQRGLRTLQTLQAQFQQADTRLQKFGLGLAQWAEVEWQKLRRQALQCCDQLAQQWQALEGHCPELLPSQRHWLARLEQADTQALQQVVLAQRQLLLQAEGQQMKPSEASAQSPSLLLSCSNLLQELTLCFQSWLPRLESFAQVKPWKQAAQQYQALLAQFEAAQPQWLALENALWQMADSPQSSQQMSQQMSTPQNAEQVLGQAQQLMGKFIQGINSVNLPELALPTQEEA